MFTLLNYNLSAAGINDVNTDAVAIDPDFSIVNSHYIFTDPLQILACTLLGASVTRGRFQSPKLNAMGEVSIFAANRAITPPSNPIIDDYRDNPLAVPQNEEVQLQISNNLGASTEVENGLLWLGTPDWRQQIEQGLLNYIARFTFTVTPTLNNWSGGQAITFSQKPLGGVYAVNGMMLQGANAAAYRVIFPRSRMYSGRKPRPGGLTQTAVGDVPNIQNGMYPYGMGVWGYFHTFEPPTVEVWGTVAGSITYQGFMFLSYLGQDVNILMQKIAKNY